MMSQDCGLLGLGLVGCCFNFIRPGSLPAFNSPSRRTSAQSTEAAQAWAVNEHEARSEYQTSRVNQGRCPLFPQSPLLHALLSFANLLVSHNDRRCAAVMRYRIEEEEEVETVFPHRVFVVEIATKKESCYALLLLSKSGFFLGSEVDP